MGEGGHFGSIEETLKSAWGLGEVTVISGIKGNNAQKMPSKCLPIAVNYIDDDSDLCPQQVCKLLRKGRATTGAGFLSQEFAKSSRLTENDLSDDFLNSLKEGTP